MKTTEKWLLDNVMPCGLICYTCSGYNHGALKEAANKMLRYLDGYESFLAQKFPDKLEKYNIGIEFHQFCVLLVCGQILEINIINIIIIIAIFGLRIN